MKSLVCYENNFCKQTVKDRNLRWSPPDFFLWISEGIKFFLKKFKIIAPFVPFRRLLLEGINAVIRNLNTTPIMYSAYLITAPTN